jgi:hypothetical protein
MPRSDFVPAAAAPIKGHFNRWNIGIADGVASELAFDPLRPGSQLYPTLKPDHVGNLLRRSVELAKRGLAHLPLAESNRITGFVTTLNVGKAIGFDAYRDADGKGDALNDKLGLNPLGGGKIIDVAVSGPTEDDLYDPFFTFLVASRLQAHFRVERLPGRPPQVIMDDVDVTSRPAPAFQNDEEIKPHGPLLLLGTPAQRLMLWDMLMGPKARFGKRSEPNLPTLFLPKQPHPSPVARSIARLTLGGSNG